MCEFKFSWIICGLQSYVGWRQSVHVFVFSSVVASVGNIRASIFIHRLPCLNVGTWFYNFKTWLGWSDGPLCISHMPILSMLSLFRRQTQLGGAVCSSCMDPVKQTDSRNNPPSPHPPLPRPPQPNRAAAFHFQITHHQNDHHSLFQRHPPPAPAGSGSSGRRSLWHGSWVWGSAGSFPRAGHSCHWRFGGDPLLGPGAGRSRRWRGGWQGLEGWWCWGPGWTSACCSLHSLSLQGNNQSWVNLNIAASGRVATSSINRSLCLSASVMIWNSTCWT